MGSEKRGPEKWVVLTYFLMQVSLEFVYREKLVDRIPLKFQEGKARSLWL